MSLYAEPADAASLEMTKALKEWADEQGWSKVDLMLIALCVATEMALDHIEWLGPSDLDFLH